MEATDNDARDALREIATTLTPARARITFPALERLPDGTRILSAELSVKSVKTGEYLTEPTPLLLGSHSPISDSDVPRPTMTVEWSE